MGASVLAAVGTLAHRMPARCPDAFAASIAEPPPTEADDHVGVGRADRLDEVVDRLRGGEPAEADALDAQVGVRERVRTASSTIPQTTSSATSSGRFPIGATNSPTRVIASFPWT